MESVFSLIGKSGVREFKREKKKSLVQLGSYLKDNFLFALTNVFLGGKCALYQDAELKLEAYCVERFLSK